MDKKKLKLIKRASIGAFIAASALSVCLILPSLSWFSPATVSPIKVDGNVHGSYFESGNGTEEEPFEIARPIQLYYLSWLQEMGYFNEAVVNSETGQLELKQQYHFYLSKDIDMHVVNGEQDFIYNIPPIGTVQYPFVGSFDGKGHSITNLNIINDVSEYTNDPYNPNGTSDPGPGYEILGMFGVLGTTNTDEYYNTVNCSSMNSSGALVLQDNDAIFDPAQTYVKNFYLDEVTIQASSDEAHALVGIVAGYANAPITGVGIKTSTISVASGRQAINNVVGTESNAVLSKYLSVGFAMPEYERSLEEVDQKIYTPKATQSSLVNNSTGDDWGGSLEFESILERVRKSRNLSGSLTNQIPTYPSEQFVVKDVDGTELQRTTTATSRNPISTGSSNVYYKQDDDIGSYYYKLMADSGAKKVYIGGLSDIPSFNGCTSSALTENIISKTAQTEAAYYFQDANGYIGMNPNGTIAHFATTENAIKWHYNSTNQDVYSLQNINNNYQYVHLNCVDDIYSIGTSSTTPWSFSNGNFGIPDLTPIGNPISFAIRSARYVNEDGQTTTATNSTKIKGPVTWSLNNTNLPAGVYKIEVMFKLTSSGHTGRTLYDDNGTTPTYYFSVNSTDFYPEDHTSSRSQLGLNTSNFNPITYVPAVSVPEGTKTLVLRYAAKDGYSMYCDGIRATPLAGFTTVTTVATTDNKYTTSTNITRGGQSGYIPLSVDGLKTDFLSNSNPSIDKYKTAKSNTGYIVGGYYDKRNGGDGQSAQYTGDVRIAAYEISNIQNSYSTSTKDFTNIQTYDATGKHTIDKSEYTTGGTGAKTYKKLASSLSNLKETLNGSSYVYGIHFMDSTISKDHIITAPKATVNGTDYVNYELPEDCVDFSLKAKGYINFFAGDYQNNNDAFFALCEIFRDPNNPSVITDIKELKYVYGPSDGSSRDYIYRYTDGTYSTTGVQVGANNTITKSFSGENVTYKILFDTAWIANNGSVQPKGKNLWYFEIPCNKGEFALGSCPGACGGYLVYLDISAAAQTIERKEVNEYFVKKTLNTNIANGTQFVAEIPDPLDNTEDITKQVRNTSTIDDLNSYNASLNTNASGNYNIDRTGNNITSSNQTGVQDSYLGPGVTLNNSNTNQYVETVIRRITDYDYNTMTGLYVKQVTTIETMGNQNTARTTIYNCTKDFASVITNVATFSYSWVGTGPIFSYKYFLSVADSGGEDSLEVTFDIADSAGIDVTVEELAAGFIFKVRGVDTTIPSTAVTASAHPTIHVDATEIDYTPDVWYDFTKAKGGYTANEGTINPTQIAQFHYLTQYDEDIELICVLVDYAALGGIEQANATPVGIAINGDYTYYFILTGADPVPVSGDSSTYVYVWYVGTNIDVQTGDGSQYIYFVQTTDGQWIRVA